MAYATALRPPSFTKHSARRNEGASASQVYRNLNGRLVCATILAVALFHHIDALHLLSGAEYLSVFDADQLQARAMLSLTAFDDAWAVGLVLFGLHLVGVGYLAFVSGHVPRWLGVVLIGCLALWIALSPNFGGDQTDVER